MQKDDTSLVIATYAMQPLPLSQDYTLDTTQGGWVEPAALREASGLAASQRAPGLFWSHNDSGHAARLFALDSRGALIGILLLQGAGSRDWEDIAIGPGPESGQPYLYVADIGDNAGIHPFVVIYGFPEPDPTLLHPDTLRYLPADSLARFEWMYPDGPRDAESFMVDPLSGDWFIVSKRDAHATVYRAAWPQSAGKPGLLEKRLQLPFSGAVAADISPDGHLIAIKDLYTIYVWQRKPGETVINALQRPPVRLPYQLEPKGESFAWRTDQAGYATLSEKGALSAPPVPLYLYKKQ